MTQRRRMLQTLGAAGVGAIAAASVDTTPRAVAAGTSISSVFDVKAYGAVGNSVADDTAAIQTAINDARSSNKGGVVWFPPGVYKIDPPGLFVTDQVTLAGVGWETGRGTTGTNPATRVDQNGSWLYVDKGGFVPLNIGGRGTIVQDIAIAHDQPTPTGPGWSPSNRVYDFAIHVYVDDVHLENIFLRNPTRGILIDAPGGVVGRVTLNRIWGQPLFRGIQIDNALDIVRINDVHFWPFWSDNDNVRSYQRNNATAILSFRNDAPLLSNIFCFFYNNGILFGSSATGVTSAFQMVNIYCDFCNYGIRITGPFTTGQLSNYRYLGAVGVNGLSSSVGGVIIQASNIRISDVSANAIRAEAGTNFQIENVLIEDWDKSGQRFPGIEAVAPASVSVGFNRLFLRGNGAPLTGGTGSVRLDS